MTSAPRVHAASSSPNLSALFRVFGRIGLLSFGGPAAQISLMHEDLVEKHKWLTEKQFLGALSFCMLLPGPEAMQLATYAGWRLRGITGGLLAGLLFVLPGATIILALAIFYAWYGDIPLARALFLGIKAAVVAIILKALTNLSRKALVKTHFWALALLAFLAMFILSVPFPLVIAMAAIWGALTANTSDLTETNISGGAPSFSRSCIIAAIWGTLWATPLISAWLADDQFLVNIGIFFSKLAIVTFGGAYAVLAYMAQSVIETHGWISPQAMIDALGLAETTPGPLILVTEFVAVLAGHIQGGIELAILAGAMALWVTFIPCFLWVFVMAPYVEPLLRRPRLSGALNGISAAVVGVILNLSIWFALHVLFATVSDSPFGPLPDISSFQPLNAFLIGVACLLHLGLKFPMLPLLILMSAFGTVLTSIS